MSGEEKQIEGRLSVLYAISLFGTSAPLNRLKNLFRDGLGLPESEWLDLLADITESDLIRRLNDDIIMTDNGMVVLSFFQDRIPNQTIERFQELTAQANALTHYEWQSWYDSRHQMFNLMQLKDHLRILHIQFDCPPEEATELLTLSYSPNDQFVEELKQFLKTQKET